VFGANTNAFSSRFSGFSICHPIYHENTMLLATRHAIYSDAVSTEETATFMLLPSWNKNMTTNPYASLCRKYPRMCKFLGNIPSNQLQYAKVLFWNNIQIPLSKRTWEFREFEDHCHMEHQGQGLPQCSQQRLAKRTCPRNPLGKVGNLKHT